MNGRFSSNASAACAFGSNDRAIQESPSIAVDGVCGASLLADFVRTPFSVRCNVVKFWRPLPVNLWTGLRSNTDILGSRHREKRALLAIAAMAVVLLVGFAGMGYRAQEFGGTVSYPLFGAASTLPAELDLPPGWYYAPSLAIPLAAWTVFPSLLGWAAVRWIWVPFIAKGSHTRENALAMARHLSGVYLYVYLMIFIGAVVMFLLSGTAPLQTGVVRTWLWCFLFGESFFVPALMWWRLVANDSSGTVFGRLRYAIFGVYLLFFVVTPLAGMCMEVLG